MNTTHSRAIFRHSNRDVLLVALSLCHLAAIVFVPSVPLIALALWWNSNTIAHNFIHLPFFRSNLWNRVYSVFLSLLLGYPQSLWRERHLAHHGGHRLSWRWNAALAGEGIAIALLWSVLLIGRPHFFWLTYLPGIALGLCLCYLHGYFEHFAGTTSHYGSAYNALFFNDGYHVEHHRFPGEHWARLPVVANANAHASVWPAVLRWLDLLSIESLERCAMRSPRLQHFLLATHGRALHRLLPLLTPVRSVTIIGGGMYPRTAILLRSLLPDASITIVDARAEHIAAARPFLPEGVNAEMRLFRADSAEQADLVVIPLSFIGDRRAVYTNPPARMVLVHDWLWSRKGRGVVVSLFLLKRLNLVLRSH